MQNKEPSVGGGGGGGEYGYFLEMHNRSRGANNEPPRNET